jgi:pyrophosphatase PpaX
MSLRGIIFDLDGTLANTLPVCVQAAQLTVEHFTGQRPAKAEIYAQFGPTEEGLLEYFVPGRLAETLPLYLEAYERFHTTLCLAPFPGVEHLLTTLQTRGIRSAIVTGKGQYSAAITLRILGLGRWIDSVETGFPERADKPLSIRRVLERWEMSPEQAAYVGDTPYDMQAARSAGVLALGAAWAETSILRQDHRSQAEMTFQDIDCFLKFIDTQASG